jgi:sRNA-binding regulator protein Hfq
MKKQVYLFILNALLLSANANAADEYTIMIKNHVFTPAQLTVPADKKIKLIIENQDATPEEFESYPLNREKVIAANGKASVYVGPLKPGRYPFFGEFNEATAQGTLIVE